MKLWKSSYASVGSWQWKWKEVPIAFMMKSSEISNENVSCGHTTLKMDNMDMLANILRLLSGRSGGRWTWSSLFLACRWPPLKSHFVPPFFSCLALIKNFGPSRSKHTTKLTNPILFSWLARDHRHWEVFYKCNQCNYEYTFVENLRIHKQIFTNASNVTTNAFSVGCLMNHIFFSQIQPMTM